ncbi:MAG: hypothetical protein R3E79_25175 [Caldilineaceae bacterium]
MNAVQRVFLDTTIQIERVTGTRSRQAEIAQALTGLQVLTSTYVLGEYLRTLVQDALLPPETFRVCETRKVWACA